ncbi:DNA-binding SARP family transcriptional activator [Saccharothrix texasensis]|uniref:DNA-binding SARP family transcriptional activator n=2 Tax=Saccharothrix texasensis TaxID=103734 RepID=A0A3N1HHB4_9PSEU|nr:DNA-binding SARP family transcriptional activator [Saccharothrix texasensis]
MTGRSVEFRLWGQVAAYRDGERVDLGTEKEQCLLVALAGKSTRVRRDALPEWLWDDPPDSAASEIDRYMTRLRGRLVAAGIGDLLENRNRLCRLDVVDAQVDVRRFEALIARARSVADGQAATLLAEALELAEGVPLAGLRSRRIDAYRTALVEQRLAARIRLAEIEIGLGRYRECVPGLVELFLEHPGNAEVTRLTMSSLHFAGRTQDALDTFATHRKQVVENGGLEVDAELGKLQRLIMDNAESLRRPVVQRPAHVIPVPFPPPQEVQRELIVVLRPDDEDLTALRTAISRSFRRDGIDVSVADDRLVCVVPADVPHAEVVTSWLDRVAAEVRFPVRVGVSVEDEELATELAGSDYARRVLAAARTKNLVVVVSDELHEAVVRRQGGPNELRSYRQVEEYPGGWVRVPGYSVPPRPVRVEERRRGPRSGDVLKGPTVYVQGRARIGEQFNAAVINMNARRRDER